MAAARALAKKARKGSIAHFQEAANRLEGKVEFERRIGRRRDVQCDYLGSQATSARNGRWQRTR